MEQTLNVNTTSRNMISKILENHTLEQLNKIPEGFSNNLIWNAAHVIVTQQILVYKLSGLPVMVSEEMIEKIQKRSQAGTRCYPSRSGRNQVLVVLDHRKNKGRLCQRNFQELYRISDFNRFCADKCRRSNEFQQLP